MNPSVNSAPDGHGDPSWPSESWDQTVAPVCCGLDTRHFQVSRYDWEWDNPTILAPQHSIDLADYKPSIMQTDAITTGPRQYNGLVSNTFPSSSNLSHNHWSLFNAQTLRNGEGIDQTPGLTFASAPAAALYGLGGSSALTGYYAGNGGYVEARLPYDPHRHLLGLVNFDQRRLQDIMKRDICNNADLTGRLGLNLGGRTYFSAEDNSLARFGKRPRPNSPGIIVPLCQAEGCKADLSNAKHYHRRHKVCEFHSKAATVVIGGQTQRFCQQCSRFHILSEFDEGKRSCRKRLADHNRRRRKPQPNASTSGSCTTDTAAQKTDAHDGLAGDTHNGNGKTDRPPPCLGGQTNGSASADKSQALVSAISLTSSVPLTIQNGKKQLCANSSSNEKETYQKFMQGSRAGPSLSLSPFSGGASIASQGQASGKGFGKVDLPVTWLKAADSSSNLTESAAARSISVNNLSDLGSPKRHFVESVESSSNIQALSHSQQNLMPISTSTDQGGNSDWKMKHISDHEREQLAEFGSSNVNLQGRSEGQEALSLLQGGHFPKHQRKNAQASLDFLQHELSSTINMNEADYPTTEKKPDIKFSGLQGLRQFTRSIYNTENVP